MNRRSFLKVVAVGLAAPVQDKSMVFRQTGMDKEVILTKEALRIHQAAIVIDTHNDLLYKSRTKGVSILDLDLRSSQPDFHTDIPRLRKGGVGAQFWVADGGLVKPGKGKSSPGTCLEDINLIHRMVEKYPDVFEMGLFRRRYRAYPQEGKDRIADLEYAGRGIRPMLAHPLDERIL